MFELSKIRRNGGSIVMARYNKYRPDYSKLYPGVEEKPEIVHVLKKSDRKMEYYESELKSERFVHDNDKSMATFIPAREDSFERIESEERQFAARELTPEERVIQKLDHDWLHSKIALLSEDEQAVLYLRYWGGMSQRETAEELSISQQAVSYRERRALKKLRKFLENAKNRL